MAQTSSLTTAALIRSHRPLWRVVTHNPFLVGVRDGDLPGQVFGQWLAQDECFVDALFPCICRVLAMSPAQDRPVLVEALQGISRQHEWFKARRAMRRLPHRTSPRSVTRAYVDFLTAVSLESYPIGLVLLWGQYRVYADAWAGVRPVPARFRDVVSQWASPEYRRFVGRLGRAADRTLRSASAAERARASEVFAEMLQYELAFWVDVIEGTPTRRSKVPRRG